VLGGLSQIPPTILLRLRKEVNSTAKKDKDKKEIKGQEGALGILATVLGGIRPRA
jgi:hypothetical protein